MSVKDCDCFEMVVKQKSLWIDVSYENICIMLPHNLITLNIFTFDLKSQINPTTSSPYTINQRKKKSVNN